MKPTAPKQPASAKLPITDKLVESVRPSASKFDITDTKQPGFVLRVTPGGKRTFYVRWWNAKQWRWHKIAEWPDLSPQEARKEAERIRGDVAKGHDPIAAKRAAREAENPVTLEQFITEQYGPVWVAKRRRGQEMLDRIKHCFEKFYPKPIAEVKHSDIEKWRAKALDEGKATATVNKEVTLLKSVFNRAVEWGVIQSNPLANVKSLKVDKAGIVRYLTDKEETALLKALEDREETARKERDSANKWRSDREYDPLPDLRAVAFVDALRPVVLLSLNTGLRRGEVFHLRWEDVDLDRAMLTVRGKTAKSGQTRHVPLNSVALDALKKWHAQTDGVGVVFKSTKTGNRLDNLQTSWEGILTEAKIESFRWHDMRHHFASKLVMAGVDLNTVRDLLGHSDIKMTLRYAHLSPAIKQNAVERLVKKPGKVVQFPKGKRTAK